jgi:hypothetical protein
VFLVRAHAKCVCACRHQSGDGDQLVRHCEHPAGAGHDEVLEGQAHHTEETGRLPGCI